MKPANLGRVLICVAVLTGCSSVATDAEKPPVNLTGYPPAFRDGYLDGCHSAREPRNVVKDESRFASDSMYAAGWRDGHDICSGKTYD